MHNNLTLQVVNISKTINERLLFKSVNIEIKKGDICCLQGKNGTGKSIFIDCILGFQPVDSGKILLNGKDITDRLHVRKNSAIVALDHQSHLDLFTPEEYFKLMIDLYGVSMSEGVQFYNELIQKLSVKEYMDDQIQFLSFGTKKKIQLIGSLLTRPDLLVCDEIFEGLDKESVDEVKQIFITRSKNNQATFFTTHQNVENMDILTKHFLLENNLISLLGENQ